MKKTVFILSLLLIYCIHLILKFNDADVPEWMSSWLADLICMPLMLALTLLTARKIRRDPFLLLSQAHLVFIGVYVCAMFEWVLPKLNNRFTADPVDALMYALGTLIFSVIQSPFFGPTKTNGRDPSY